MKIGLSLLLLMVIIASCTKTVPAKKVLNTENLKSSFIIIKPSLAYKLKTFKGAIINIAAGTFVTTDGSPVEIEIKEAYSAQDIIKAGLTTLGNGKPLRTGGMIFFKATARGKVLEFKKAIEISVPSHVYDPEMQLFKGELTADSTVNWTAPTPLDIASDAQQLFLGEAIFKNNCASCHKPNVDFTGPALANLEKRVPSRQWIYDFIYSPEKMIAKGDQHSIQSYNFWRPTVMTAFPQLTHSDIDAVLAYANNYAVLYPDDQSYLGNDTSNICGYDTSYISNTNLQPVSDIAILPDSISGTSFNAINATEAKTENFINSPPAYMYNFSIDASGWYNVDAYVSTAVDVTVGAEINGTEEMAIEVYLFCPQKKILVSGNSKNYINFVFSYDGGEKIPLTLDDKAVMLAVGNNGDKIFYGAAGFMIAPSQKIPITLKETTKDELMKFMGSNKIDDVTLDIYTNEKIVTEILCNTPNTRPVSNQ